jgi:hypothetical protein
VVSLLQVDDSPVSTSVVIKKDKKKAKNKALQEIHEEKTVPMVLTPCKSISV